MSEPDDAPERRTVADQLAPMERDPRVSPELYAAIVEALAWAHALDHRARGVEPA